MKAVLITAGLGLAGFADVGCCDHKRPATQADIGYTDSYASYPPPNVEGNPLVSYDSYPPPNVTENPLQSYASYPQTEEGEHLNAMPAGERIDGTDWDIDRDDR